MKYAKRIGLTLLALLLVAVVGFVIWAKMGYGPTTDALAAMQSDATVTVQRMDGGWLEFRPAAEADTALVLYPGAKVDPQAYAPAAHALAAQGYLVAVLEVPLNLAILSTGKAGDVQAAHPEIAHWAVGGHSLGGTVAAMYAADHLDALDGIVFWAAYPAEGDSLAATDLQGLALYGALDGLLTAEDRAGARPRFPSGTAWVVLEGANHAQFGAYGIQSGDRAATISHADQQAAVVAATAGFLASLRP